MKGEGRCQQGVLPAGGAAAVSEGCGGEAGGAEEVAAGGGEGVPGVGVEVIMVTMLVVMVMVLVLVVVVVMVLVMPPPASPQTLQAVPAHRTGQGARSW